MTDHLLLVDASGFAYRAFYAWPAVRRNSDGEPIGAILGFMSMIWRLLGAAEEDKPTLGAAIFDKPGRTFRHKLFPEYKANRTEARSLELAKQIPIMYEVAAVLGLTPLALDGFEADDLIATLATRAMSEGVRTTIVSSDKDFGQLVVDGHIEIIDPMANRRVRSADVRTKFGVEPGKVAEVQALAGDAVDNIPGIPGCGIEKAAALIRRFGSLNEVLRNVEECRWPGVRNALKRHGPKAKDYLKLTTLKRTVPLDVALCDLTIKPTVKSHVMAILRALESEPRFQSLFAIDFQMIRIVTPVKDAFAWWREELQCPGQAVPEEPQCGFYMRRLVRGGPWVPAKIWREKEFDPETGSATGREWLRCQVGERHRDPYAEWNALCQRPIERSAFNWENADFAHARLYRPDDPKANPAQPIDLLNSPVSRNPRAKGTTA